MQCVYCAPCIEKETKIQRVYMINKSSKQKVELKRQLQGLPWWLSGKESIHQCRRLVFDP